MDVDQAQKGSKVRIEYMGRLDDGTVFGTNRMGDLLEFTVGNAELLPALENAVIGMSVGETRMLTLSPEEAYGLRDESLIAKPPRSKFPSDAKLEPGTTLSMHSKGEDMEVAVVAVDGEDVTIDANHPLAGKQLTFEVELMEIVG
jgi:peptidylprolyl isomerase